MIKYGILSTASIIDRFVNAIRESECGEVYAIASRTKEKAKIAAERLNIDLYYGTYEELYNDENIDVIYIPTVNKYHYRDARNALMHKKHVILEKPFTMNKEEAIELFDIAKANNVLLMEGQKCVFLPTNQKVKELIQSNIIGEVKYIDLQAGFPVRFPYDHWMYDLSMGGGSFYGSAAYTIEYMQYLFDTLDLSINGSYVPSPTGSDEMSHFELVLDHQILVSSTITMNIPLQNKAKFYGDKGYIEVDHYWKARKCDVYLYNGEHHHYEYPCDHEFVYEINHFNECIEKHLLESPIMYKEKTIQTVDLIDSLYKKWKLKA